MSIPDDEVEAANVADRILRVVRRFIAAEHKHADLIGSPETELATSRDDVDMEHATLVGFTIEQVDQALRIVQRRAAAKVRAIREGDGEATHRHVKRGTEYVLIGIGKIQSDYWSDGQGHVDMREVAIYRSVDDGSMWVRPREEFEDGRFEALTAEVDGNKPS